jgi:hypothetical protein
MGRIVKVLKGTAKIGKKVASMEAVRGIANHALELGLGSKSVTVEGIAAAPMQILHVLTG